MLEDLKRLLEVEDPVDRGQRATALLTECQSAITELARIRREVIDELRQRGMTQADVAKALGLTRARVSQLAKAGPPPERAFLGIGPLTVVVALKKESEFGRPAVAQETVEAANSLQTFARGMDLESTLEYVPPPGIFDLNRDNLVVMLGPRLSPLVAQLLEADSSLKFRKDDQGWHLVDQRAGEVYRSPMDTGGNSCIGYLARVPRPDQHGTFLYACGIHAMGLQGVIHYVENNLPRLYEEVRTRRFSAVVGCDFDPEGHQVTASRLLTPLYRHDEA
ncbi:sigma factor-like helix-turn-helix DNA-binding protein [Streptosporangium algeriense]|uniref:Sigma factor-like helix-turn-helix DNA-binding protein n=1 Tax=Streptosporangium algeriense TaxID=1682748 RepID=A0ABW3DZ28_9ACTN